MLDGGGGSRPAVLVKDGDLILLIGRILEMRGRDTVRVSKVKGHADESMVRDGGLVSWIAWEMMQLMMRLILVVGGCTLLPVVSLPELTGEMLAVGFFVGRVSLLVV